MPACWSRQHTSTSSPARRYCASKPLIGEKGLSTKGHVAAGNVLRDLVALQDVRRLAGGRGYTGGQPAVLGSEVRSADRRGAAALQLVDEMGQPVRIREAVGVRVGDDVPGGGLQPNVAGGAQAPVGLMDGVAPRG